METFQIKHLLFIATILVTLWILIFLFLPYCQAIEVSELIKDCFGSILAISGAFVAIIGLDTWKQEIKGNKKINLIENLYSDIKKLNKRLNDASTTSIPNIIIEEKFRDYMAGKRIDKDFDQILEMTLQIYEERITNSWKEIFRKIEDIEEYFGKIDLYFSSGLEQLIYELIQKIKKAYNSEIEPSLLYFKHPEDDSLYELFKTVNEKYLNHSKDIQKDNIFGEEINEILNQIRDNVNDYFK